MDLEQCLREVLAHYPKMITFSYGRASSHAFFHFLSTPMQLLHELSIREPELSGA